METAKTLGMILYGIGMLLVLLSLVGNNNKKSSFCLIAAGIVGLVSGHFVMKM